MSNRSNSVNDKNKIYSKVLDGIMQNAKKYDISKISDDDSEMDTQSSKSSEPDLEGGELEDEINIHTLINKIAYELLKLVIGELPSNLDNDFIINVGAMRKIAKCIDKSKLESSDLDNEIDQFFEPCQANSKK